MERNIKRQLAAVPSTVSRDHIEKVVSTFMSTYPVRDVETRLSLFAENLRFDDPAGLKFADNRHELRQFFEDTIARGITIRFFPERLIVNGDEALQIARLLLQVDDTDPVLLLLHMHFVFGSGGLITELRNFFDEDCALVSPRRD